MRFMTVCLNEYMYIWDELPGTAEEGNKKFAIKKWA